ncbi:MAG: hypothetical protein NT033_08575 [Candidatus Omnitrophica bacterium]|nr:hypothetical protein [Candidatus Omnitrophota bacterium]
MLEQIKLGGEYFDNDFGFFYEDLDVAWRAQRHGFRGYYIPTAVAYHLRGFTARKGEGIDKPFARRFLSNELHARLIRNRYLAMLKNESLSGFLLRLPFIFLYDCASLAFVLLFKRGVFNNFGGSLKCFKGSLERRRLIKILLQQKTI